MNITECVLGIIEDLGYQPKVDNDGNLVFKFQLKNIVVNVSEECHNVIMGMALLSVEATETMQALVIANELNLNLRYLRLALDSNFEYVYAVYNFIFFDEATAKKDIMTGLDAFSDVKTTFIDKMRIFKRKNSDSSDDDNSLDNDMLDDDDSSEEICTEGNLN